MPPNLKNKPFRYNKIANIIRQDIKKPLLSIKSRGFSLRLRLWKNKKELKIAKTATNSRSKHKIIFADYLLMDNINVL